MNEGMQSGSSADSTVVPLPFSSYRRRLFAEALMRDAAFRPHRRHWVADADRRRIEARTCAAGLVEHLYRCGIRWSRLPPAQPHRTP